MRARVLVLVCLLVCVCVCLCRCRCVGVRARVCVRVHVCARTRVCSTQPPTIHTRTSSESPRGPIPRRWRRGSDRSGPGRYDAACRGVKEGEGALGTGHSDMILPGGQHQQQQSPAPPHPHTLANRPRPRPRTPRDVRAIRRFGPGPVAAADVAAELEALSSEGPRAAPTPTPTARQRALGRATRKGARRTAEGSKRTKMRGARSTRPSPAHGSARAARRPSARGRSPMPVRGPTGPRACLRSHGHRQWHRDWHARLGLTGRLGAYSAAARGPRRLRGSPPAAASQPATGRCLRVGATCSGCQSARTGPTARRQQALRGEHRGELYEVNIWMWPVALRPGPLPHGVYRGV